MIINHTSNPNLFALVTDRSRNRPLMKKLSKLLGAINHLDGIDPETRSKLYERAVDAVFAAEENAFDKAAEMQAAITTDELITHDD